MIFVFLPINACKFRIAVSKSVVGMLALRTLQENGACVYRSENGSLTTVGGSVLEVKRCCILRLYAIVPLIIVLALVPVFTS